MFEENVRLEDVLLVVALGHGLEGSKSKLTMLPKDIVQRILVREIEKCYWNSRQMIGLLTPPENITTRCNRISGVMPFKDLEFQRGTVPPVSSFAQAKENVVVSFPETATALTNSTISRFISNRYNNLFKQLEPIRSQVSKDGALTRRALSPTARKPFRRINDLP
jgi:hypothetical protein